MKKTLRICFVFIMLFALTSCGSNNREPLPTSDPSIIITEVAETIMAELTQTYMAMPTSTPTLPPTETPLPAPTLTPIIPTVTPKGMLPAAVSVSQPDTSASNAQVMQQQIQAQPQQIQVQQQAPVAKAGDAASYKGQSIDNGHVDAGEDFDLLWYFTNTGSTTWTTDYSIRYYTGTNFAKNGNTKFHLVEPVAPGADGFARIDAVAPKEPGTYAMTWVLSNENDVNFFLVDVTIIVDN